MPVLIHSTPDVKQISNYLCIYNYRFLDLAWPPAKWTPDVLPMWHLRLLEGGTVAMGGQGK